MSIRRLSRNAGAATLQVIASAILMFVLYRLLIRELGAERMGIWSLLLAGTAFARLAECGLGGAVSKFAAADWGDGEGARAASTIGMSLMMMAAGVGVACVVLFPLLWQGLAFFVEDDLLESARSLVPWVVSALWFGVLAQVFLSGLDACQRTDLKVVIIVCGGAGQVIAAYVIVPAHGLEGLGAIQLAQSIFSMVLSAFFLTRLIRQPLANWLRWDSKRFSTLFSYGSRLQVAAVGQVLFDPTVKAMLTLSGGLAFTGYYEMANRAVTQCRAVVVSAYQTLVPWVAHRAGAKGLSDEEVVGTYNSAQSILFVSVVPYFAVLTATMPLLLTIWIGRFEETLVTIGIICCVGWTVNSLFVPAYVLSLATGRANWTMWTQLAIGFLSVIFGGVGGIVYGGLGVVVGAMLALALGSSLVAAMFSLHHKVPVSFAWFGTRQVAAVGLLGTGLAIAQLSTGLEPETRALWVVELALFVTLVTFTVARNPIVAALWTSLRAEVRAA